MEVSSPQARRTRALEIVHEDDLARKAIQDTAMGAPTGWKGQVDMGGFLVCSDADAPQNTALSTCGICSCALIVVHCIDNKGALGHFANTETVDKIVKAVRDMIGVLSPSAVDCVVIAGGLGAADETERELVVKGINALGVTDAVWIKEIKGDTGFDGGVYLPKQGKLALYSDTKPGTVPFDSSNKLGLYNYTGGKPYKWR
ncbi:MAG: hypothetical protein NTZ56_01085 [Acidobacteria bacterium]|nr:hypothetical protein [Acidobacteriota bacterium]